MIAMIFGKSLVVDNDEKRSGLLHVKRGRGVCLVIKFIARQHTLSVVKLPGPFNT